MPHQAPADGQPIARVREEADANLSHTFRALADVDYRIILETLARERDPMTAHEVARQLGRRHINVANVLRQLRRNRAVVMSGTRHHARYRLVVGNLVAASRWLERFRALLDESEAPPLPARDGTVLREAAFETLLDGVEDAVAIVREGGAFEYANEAFARLAGVTVGELYFAELGEFLLLPDRAAFAAGRFRNAIDELLSIVRRNGTVVTVRYSMRTIETGKREAIGWAIIARPVETPKLSVVP